MLCISSSSVVGRERNGDTGNTSSGTSISSPPENLDGNVGGLNGGYEAFVEKKKSSGVGYVLQSVPSSID